MGKTRGVHETTPEIRNRMVGMYEAGLGLKEIAVAVNCSQRTVKRWLNRFDREGNVDTRERCGRKRATTHEEDEAIIRLATETPITAAKAVLPALGLNCSVDTIRERLHKAGIHNWSPSRKHIQKIPIAPTDGAGIQQAVWRPTGTQLGKKKPTTTKEPVKSAKTNSPPTKKKTTPARKAKSKKVFDEEVAPTGTADQVEVQQPNFSFTNTAAQNELAMNEMQALPASAPLPIPPPPPPTTHPPPPHPVISSNSNQYSHPLNLIPQSQAIYHHHPGLNVSQNWPLDLVQGAHHYAQSQQAVIHHEQQHATMHIHRHQSHPQIHSHHDIHDAQLPHHMQDQIQTSIHPQQQLDNHRMNVDNQRDLTSAEFSRSEETISNACIDVCSNSNASSNGNSQHSSADEDDDVSSDNDCVPSKSRKASKRKKKKKGGKVKGTLETSVEIRNRMIGMSEAGLSTLSIALAINRSERTVKRWLDRWHKEGNVQTKERKGRRRITTKEEDDAIVQLATQQPLTAAKNVAPALGLKCSVDTIRERLHKAGIHSWKLGKKQGVGNTVHTVHLWQSSGNRSSKLKISANKKRKPCNKKRNRSSEDSSKRSSKNTSDETPAEVAPAASSVIHQEPNLQFQNQSQSPPIMQATHELSPSTNTEFIQPRQHMQVPPICTQGPLPPQTLQAMGPIMHPRPDCRLSLSTLAPPLHTQASANLSYSSCMLGNSSHHTTHMEQADPMNYEPYIWSF